MSLRIVINIIAIIFLGATTYAQSSPTELARLPDLEDEEGFDPADPTSIEAGTLHTTHGSGSDVDRDGYAESFGNVPDSKKSSVGFYRVAETYNGKYGRSVRLDGLSSTNSNVRKRAIVVHGSDYVHEANVIQGRSAGCLALDWSVKDSVVDKIYGGSLLYADTSR